MRIAVVSRSDASGGGASRVAHDLVRLLAADGHHVEHFVGEFGRARRWPLVDLHGGALRGLRLLFQDLEEKAGFVRLLPLEFALVGFARFVDQFDAFHFHDLAGVASPLSVARVARRRPTLWTFHDCSAFTGGCLYPSGCDLFRSRCGPCPQLGRWPLTTTVDRTGLLQDARRSVFKGGRVRVIAPSEWMKREALASGMFGETTIDVVRNGVNLQTYAPQDRALSRRFLQIPENRFVVACAAVSLDDERKGGSFLLAALRATSDLEPFVVALGDVGGAVADELAELDGHAAGFVHDERMKAAYLAAADVFVSSSVEDNAPTTIMESLACGTPVVAFAVGGVPEMIVDGDAGVLVPARDVSALAEAIRDCADDGSARRRAAARASAERLFDNQRFRDDHVRMLRDEVARRSMSASAAP